MNFGSSFQFTNETPPILSPLMISGNYFVPISKSKNIKEKQAICEYFGKKKLDDIIEKISGKWVLKSSFLLKSSNHSSTNNVGELCRQLTKTRLQFDKMLREKWELWCVALKHSYNKTIQIVGEFIASLDCAWSNLILITQKGFSFPTFSQNSPNLSSFISVKNLRHPLIEALNQRIIYVPNDLSIGTDKTGILVYGPNSSGKSSLMKSLGIAVVCAQAGIPVACTQCQMSLFKSLFTRIQGSDDIFRGMSTFAIEGKELSNILWNADKHSLVLGDEPCSGTEQEGGISIVASAVDELLKRDVPFMFATHQHLLREIPLLFENSKLEWGHMKVEIGEGRMFLTRCLELGNAGPRR